MSEEKLTLSVDEMAAMLGISRPVAYELSKKEGFPAIRVSERRIIIPVESLKRWLVKQAEGF
ncbi:MAG: helix-turn-helix domain-containing protein [Ruminococcaceae bacterium]|nr:helix-turn-helix domain-containing protein [Oscillospiraceae bacterium]